MGNLSNLETLWLDDNQLTGPIPVELGNLSNLESLNLYNNQLTGSIPVELGNLSNLKDLRLHNNELTGELSFLMRTNLERLSYEDNAGLCMLRLSSVLVWRERLSFVAGPICPPR